MKIKTVIITLFFLSTAIKPAGAHIAENSAEIKSKKTSKTDTRIITLTHYLSKKKSPLVNQAEKFIQEADKNNLETYASYCRR